MAEKKENHSTGSLETSASKEMKLLERSLQCSPSVCPRCEFVGDFSPNATHSPFCPMLEITPPQALSTVLVVSSPPRKKKKILVTSSQKAAENSSLKTNKSGTTKVNKPKKRPVKKLFEGSHSSPFARTCVGVSSSSKLVRAPFHANEKNMFNCDVALRDMCAEFVYKNGLGLTKNGKKAF